MTIAARVDHSLAIKTDGSLYAWGYNDNGELGDGTTTDQHSPVQIGKDYPAIMPATAQRGSESRRQPLRLGLEQHGPTRRRDDERQHSPEQIGSGYAAISAGGEHSIALKADGTSRVGLQQQRQLGDGTTTDS